MGPGLIAHCMSEWLIRNETPPSFVAVLPRDPHDIPDSGQLAAAEFYVRLLIILHTALILYVI